MQEACAAALAQWPREGLPAHPGGWVVAVARRRALDHLRRESARAGKERQAVQEWAAAEPDGSAVAGDDAATRVGRKATMWPLLHSRRARLLRAVLCQRKITRELGRRRRGPPRGA